MELTLRELELHKIAFDKKFSVGAIDFSETNFKQVSDLQISGEAELLTGSDDVEVRGAIRGKLERECDRCLELAPLSLDERFDLHYRPVPTDAGDVEIELDEGATEMGFYEGQGLELAAVLREQVMLWLPMHWVCGEDCQGICPECGVNRNQQKCGCSRKQEDPRWAALRDFKPSS